MQIKLVSYPIEPFQTGQRARDPHALFWIPILRDPWAVIPYFEDQSAIFCTRSGLRPCLVWNAARYRDGWRFRPAAEESSTARGRPGSPAQCASGLSTGQKNACARFRDSGLEIPTPAPAGLPERPRFRESTAANRSV